MRTYLTKLIIVYIFLVANSFTGTSGEDNWTHFRGSNLNAIANVEHAPLTWDEETNIKWKTAVHGRGWSSPVVFGNQVWVTTANTDETRARFSEMMALNPDGKGDITETNVLWSQRIVPFPLTTPVIRDGLIYTVDPNRTMKCYDAADGLEVWSHNVRGEFNSSPIYVNGKIYFNSTRGETLVIDAGRELKILAENQLDGEIWSTPAILRNSILMRTDSHMYRIGTDIK